MKLMIVDDEPAILKGLKFIISNSSTPFNEIEDAFDGIDALEKMDSFRPDLLITDISMPEIDGFELIKMAQDRGLCKKFIILTGFNEFDYARKAIRYQVLDYLLKPINKDELLALLQKIALDIGYVENELETAKLSFPIKKAISYIHENFSAVIMLEYVAEHVNLHPNYFSSLFSKETGTTFIQYLNHYRIEKSKELLLMEGKSIHDVSVMTGFENQRHFFKVFKKIVGQTPGQYKREK